MRTGTASLRATLLGAMLAAAPAAADTYTVNSTDDDVDVVPGNGVCATSDGVCTLRAAVQEANAHAGADVITLPAGLFLLTILGDGEDLGATGDLDVTDALEIDGAGAASTIVDGLKSDRVLHSLAASLTLRDFTVRHGFAPAGQGGGLFQGAPGSVVLERMHFEQSAATDGGGVFQVDGPLTISDSAFDRNFTSPGRGGALLVTGSGTLSVTNTSFTSNAAPTGDGGGVHALTTGGVTFTNSTFSGNGAGDDAGALLVGLSAAFSLDGCTFEDNRAANAVGGFLYDGPASPSVTNTKAIGNSGSGIGGGFLTSMSGSVQVSGSEFSDNVARSTGTGGLYVTASNGATITNTVLHRNVGGGGPGGGLFASVTGPGTLTIADVEASDNFAADGGGGLYLTSPTTIATRVRVLRNSSGTGPGGGIFVTAGSFMLSDSTIDGNVSSNGGGGAFVTAGTVEMTSSTLSNNLCVGTGSAGLGGGAFLAATAPSTVTNTTVSGNATGAAGGGLFTSGDVTLRNATLAENVAPSGSALYSGSGTLTVANSIIAGSAPGHCEGGAITSGDFNIDSNGTCGLAGGNDRNNTDPQLGPLADNGGPTFTHLPVASSPAIDRGNPSGCPATDQRGQVRPTDGNGDGTAVCDVGAVEFLDLCPSDPAKTLPGICGCGVPDIDAALANGVADCLVNAELKARIARATAIVTALTGDPSESALETELTGIVDGLGAYVKQFKAQLAVTDPKAKLDKLAKRARKPVKKVTKAKGGRKLEKARTKALAALGKLDQAVAPQQGGTPG